METLLIQSEIESLRERLKIETAEYKYAIADEKTFEEVKVLFTKVKITLSEIAKAVERYGLAIDKVAPEAISKHEHV